MELISMKVSRCLSIIFLATALGLLCVLVPCWHSVVKHIEHHVDESSENFVSQVQYEVERTTKLLNLMSSSSTIYTARVVASLNQSKLSFYDIQNKVAPFLFQALAITPHLTQISYFGSEGLFFSYYIDGNQTFALYSNSSMKPSNKNSSSTNPNPPISPYWYKQMANRTTGKLYGNVDQSSPLIAVSNASWFQEALHRDGLFSFVGTNLNNVDNDPLFINTATVNGKLGFVSLGFSFKEITEYYYTDIDLRGGSLCLVINGETNFKIANNLGLSTKVIKEKIDADHQQNFSCYPMNISVGASNLDKDDKETNINSYTSQINILGVQSAYVLAVPKSGLMEFVNRRSKATLVILVSFIVIMVVFIIVFLSIIFGATMRVVYLHAQNFKQMEATEQAERKSMNKTNAFNTASHDIRASLAGMAGLIQICYDQVASGSDLETNLRQLDDCAKDLLEILNSILDTSKIEAGKMLLEEEEFDVAQLLEDVVDLFHPMGAKKGIDVILDPCDSSISKFSYVKCDRGKLRQVICNLLSNAIKFTFDGQVILRAWIRERKIKNSIDASKQTRTGLLQILACVFYKSKGKHEDLEAMNMVNSDSNSIELICEVDDTGKGIPKEKRQEIFENYVQVKETALGQGGTGLGLGIVQSLVRLMHGEIGIVEKDIGEKGSCFRFNISLKICENISEGTKVYHENENNDLMKSCTPQLSALTPSPSKLEAGSCVLLLIQNNERRRISQKFMESIGIRVLAVKWPNQLRRTLRKIHRKWQSTSSNKFDFGNEIEYLRKSSASHNSCNFDVPFGSSAMDGADYVRSLFRSKTSQLRGMTPSLGFVLMVIDANSGSFQELSEVVNEFRNNLQNACCRVVWLANPMSPHCIDLLASETQMVDSDDIIKCKPFHGSRLYEVVRLLPEFGGQLSKRKVELIESSQASISHVFEAPLVVSLRDDDDDQVVKSSQSEIQEVDSSSIIEIKPLSGKKVLIVDDTRLLRQLAKHCIEKLGGTAEQCENGEEALKLVSNGLSNQMKQCGSDHIIRLPYDYILMDCEMPKKNGYEASKEIREEEKLYGVYIPIIALTAHTKGSEEANRTFKAGMDACLSKPLRDKDLLETIEQLNTKK